MRCKYINPKVLRWARKTAGYPLKTVANRSAFKSSLVYAFDHYPENIFPSFLKKLDTIIEEGRLISAEQVYEEINDGHLRDWAEKYKESIFTLPDDDEQKVCWG